MELQLDEYYARREGGRNKPVPIEQAVSDLIDRNASDGSYGAGHVERVHALATANRDFLAKLTQALHEAGALNDAAVLWLVDRVYEVAP